MIKRFEKKNSAPSDNVKKIIDKIISLENDLRDNINELIEILEDKNNWNDISSKISNSPVQSNIRGVINVENITMILI